ncbi:hypothetical protein UCD39_13415 [Nitrospirillum sp. BR 11752]|uniref:beta strand repeat-containing protein n=1 Tax=Nitrospirillum sp. BR 11752 TaxID=3104293 RepID=UPI002EC28F8A|nr:hypothetical protein [Nitrospirillum sp. BR 11752]
MLIDTSKRKTGLAARTRGLLAGSSAVAIVAALMAGVARADVTIATSIVGPLSPTGGDVIITGTGTLTDGGTFYGGHPALLLFGNATLGRINNDGLISGGNASIAQGRGIELNTSLISGVAAGTRIATISNGPNATITGYYSGIASQGGSIGTLVNSGLIAGTAGSGLQVTPGAETLDYNTWLFSRGQLSTLVNNTNATIAGYFGTEFLGSDVGEVRNAGVIKGSIVGIDVGQSQFFYNSVALPVQSGSLGTLSNQQSGTITAGNTALRLGGISAGTILNAGMISASGSLSTGVNVGSGFATHQVSTLGLLLNGDTGTIAGGRSGLILGGSTIGTLANSGLIVGGSGAGINVSDETFYTIYTIGGTTSTLLGMVPGAIASLGNSSGATIAGGEYGLQLSGGTIGTLNNAGLIKGTGTLSLGLYLPFDVYATVAAGVVTNLNNQATGTITGGKSGIQLSGGTIGTLANSGLIVGSSSAGISVYDNAFYRPNGTIFMLEGMVPGVIASVGNASGATIVGGSYGLQLHGGTIGTLDNAGLIKGAGAFGQGLFLSFYSYGTVAAIGGVATLTNEATGTIAGSYSALVLSGATIGTLANNGLIVGNSNAGISVYENAFYTYNGTTSTFTGAVSAAIGSLVNASGATIAGGSNGLGMGGGTIGTLDNAGLIEGTGTFSSGLYLSTYNYGSLTAAGAVANLINQATGTIVGGYNGLQISGATIGTLANSGSIVGGSGTGIGLYDSAFFTYSGTTSTLLGMMPGTIGSLVNTSGATIAGGNNGLQLGGGTIGTLDNAGLIKGTGTYSQGLYLSMHNYGSLTAAGNVANLINQAAGTIAGGNTGLQLSGGTIGTLSNGGVISGLTYAGIAVQSSQARIDTIINLAGGTIGNISGTVGAYGTSAAGIVNTSSSIGTIANSGAISGGIEIYGSGAVVGAIDNRAGGTISALNSGIWIGGSVGTLVNAGLISSAWNIGVNVSNRQTLDALFNAATGTIDGIGIGGTISTIDNAGLISGGGTGILARQLTVVSVTLANNVQATTTSVRTSGVPVLHNSGLINGTLAGVANAGVMGLLDNSGTIVGVAGTGVANVGQSAISTSQSQPTYFHSSVLSKAGGTLGTLTNSGLISGALTGVANAEANVMQTIMTSTFDSVNGTYVGTTSIIAAGTAAGTVGVLVNNGTILGGTERNLTAGIGLDNGGAAAIIGTLTNTGLIRGGQTGILNAGTIGALINSGTIFGGVAAIRNTGTGLLDTITNSGLIAGNVLNQGARGLTVVGGAGSIFGTFAAGSNGTATLTNTGGDVVLAGGNVALGTNMAINVGTHTVANTAGATLRLDSLVSITGNYAQSGDSALLVNVASANSYGGLQVSGAAAVTGGAIILNPSAGYSLVDGQSYTIVAAGDASSAYSGYTVVAPGHALSSMTTVVGGLTDLIVTLGSLNGGTIGTLGSGSSTTIGGGASTVGQVSGGTVTVTDGTPTLSTISGGSVNIGGGSATLGTVAGGTVNISGGNASVGQVSAGSITLGSGATISGTQTVNVSGGSLAVSGSVTSPVAVSGGTVAVGSGGIVNSSTSIQVSSGSLSISGGGIVASDQPLQVSGGSLNVAGVVAAPVQVTDAGATVSISSGGLVTQSVTASAGAMNVGGTITAPVSVSGAGATVSISSGGLVTQSVTASAGALSVGGTITAPVSVSGAGATVSISSGGLVTQSVTASAGALSVGGTITAPVSVSGAGATVSISSGGLVTQSVTASAGSLNVGGRSRHPSRCQAPAPRFRSAAAAW